jgi:hypothetical protein
MVFPIITALGPDGRTREAAELLQSGKLSGVLRQQCTAKELRFLKFLQKPPAERSLAPFEPWITAQAWSEGWRKINHNKSSSGWLHMGHLKASAAHPELAAVQSALASIPFATGYTLRRWRYALNVFIEKKPGNFDVESLRIILLFAADYNFLNKYLGRAMMARAEKNGTLPVENYGGRKRKSAAAQALNRRLVFDIFRQSRRPLAIGSNDAKSCYDRIAPNVASLSMRRLGCPEEAVAMLFRTLATLRHHVRTAYGDSELYFQAASRELPFQTVGQGNGAGPHLGG